MKYGYARISTPEQHLEIQVERLQEAGCDEIFQETFSGSKDARPQLSIMMAKLKPGDTVTVVRIDRLGRRMMKLIELITHFRENNIVFVSLENNIDTGTPIGMMVFNMFAAFSEMERELIIERTKAGLAIARAQGRRGGSKIKLTPEKVAHIKALYESKKFYNDDIMKMMDVSAPTFFRAVSGIRLPHP